MKYQATIGAPLTKKKPVTNKFKLAVESMLGDADGYKTTVTHFDSFGGELEELYKLFMVATGKSSRGLSGRGVESLEAELVQMVLDNPILRKAAVEDEKYERDHANEYLNDRCRIGETDVGYWSPRKLTITWLNEVGDECRVDIQEMR